MKRHIAVEEVDLKMEMKMKKMKPDEEDEIGRVFEERGFLNLDDNLLFEVFKHVDPRTLGVAACVSKQWHKTAEDERLWELICTRHWNNIGCGNQKLRSVVLALGGFRRLHSLFIWPLSKPPPPSSAPSSLSAAPSSSGAPFPPMIDSKQPKRWGKDEIFILFDRISSMYKHFLEPLIMSRPKPDSWEEFYRSIRRHFSCLLATYLKILKRLSVFI